MLNTFLKAKAKKAKLKKVIVEKDRKCGICKNTIPSGVKHLAILTPSGECLARYCGEYCRQKWEIRRWEAATY